MVPGKGHSNQVQDIVATDDTLVSCGMDDMIMFTKLNSVAQTGLVDWFVFNLPSTNDDTDYRVQGYLLISVQQASLSKLVWCKTNEFAMKNFFSRFFW